MERLMLQNSPWRIARERVSVDIMSASNPFKSTLSIAVAAALLLGLSACGNDNAPAGNNAAQTQPAKTATSAAKPAAQAPPATQAAQAAQAQAQAKLDSMSVQELLSAGNTSINQQRLLSPKGDNAFEYYEKALQKDPKNQAAQDALREQFPFGANAVEQSIAQNNLDDAQREIDLLSKADPGNYTLKILNSKLDAAKNQQQRLADQKAKQAADLAARQAAEKAAAAKAALAPPPAPVSPPVQKPVVQTAPPPAPVQQQPPAAPPKPAGETRAARAISAASPDYPIQAARNHQSGFATVEFTVNPDGSVANVHVINSTPGGVFNNAAAQAVSRSKFEPALKDGQPVSSVLQRRIDFNLGG